MREIECRDKPGAGSIIVESLRFSSIPGQSELFLDYLSDPTALRSFYPSAVVQNNEIAGRTSNVLNAYSTDRQVLCDVLSDQNRAFGASEKTFTNIETLRRSDAVAVLTGQQAGLFLGPLYTLYKALSAVRQADCLRAAGINAVPVFWIASEDHDIAEVSTASFTGTSGEIRTVLEDGDTEIAGLPVGRIKLTDAVTKAIGPIFEVIGKTEFTAELRMCLEEAYKPGRTFSEAFGRFLAQLTADYGLILVDPLEPRLKRLAARIYEEAILRSAEIVDSIIERDRELEAKGYSPQVLVKDDYFPLFWHDGLGVRKSLRRRSDGRVGVVGDTTSFEIGELAAMAAAEPDRFSPGVMLRPVVQDHLFPTVCYFGGGAEIAYFAQNSEVYRVLDRPVTTIFHRQSFTVIEPRYRRTLDAYRLTFSDLFRGRDAVRAEVVEKFLALENAMLFPAAEERINTELNQLDQHLSSLDPTLAANLATRRRKIIYHIGALKKKFHAVSMKKNEIADRRIDALFTSLLPNGALQERTLNVVEYIDRYGPGFVDWIYDSIDLNDKGHRTLTL
ncbi:MAG: bacillithiol biosynthesis cysteine-adding enzyme BshC [Acidobacteriota bacterium]